MIERTPVSRLHVSAISNSHYRSLPEGNSGVSGIFWRGSFDDSFIFFSAQAATTMTNPNPYIYQLFWYPEKLSEYEKSYIKHVVIARDEIPKQSQQPCYCEDPKSIEKNKTIKKITIGL
jgi:hypothetical protein